MNYQHLPLSVQYALIENDDLVTDVSLLTASPADFVSTTDQNAASRSNVDDDREWAAYMVDDDEQDSGFATMRKKVPMDGKAKKYYRNWHKHIDDYDGFEDPDAKGEVKGVDNQHIFVALEKQSSPFLLDGDDLVEEVEDDDDENSVDDDEYEYEDERRFEFDGLDVHSKVDVSRGRKTLSSLRSAPVGTAFPVLARDRCHTSNNYNLFGSTQPAAQDLFQSVTSRRSVFPTSSSRSTLVATPSPSRLVGNALVNHKNTDQKAVKYDNNDVKLDIKPDLQFKIKKEKETKPDIKDTEDEKPDIKPKIKIESEVKALVKIESDRKLGQKIENSIKTESGKDTVDITDGRKRYCEYARAEGTNKRQRV
nr:uncharacterized protein CI109_004914 [Kwoniella shandongensis]KAA5526711.1 hypothetical protein CI109_004914 [Kwoniella shandongensis]